MRLRKTVIILMAALLPVLLSGCLIKSAEELYALPQQSEAYADLQTALDGILTGQAQYSSPVSGANQQPVQMSDLDGDGLDEAIVFVNTGDKKPLKVYILDHVGGSYETIHIIEGDGTAFDRVEYAQMDGVVGTELVIGRQLGSQLPQTIGVYRFSGGGMTELMVGNYSEFAMADLDANGNDDLFLLHVDPEAGNGYASLYRCTEGELEKEPDVPLSLDAGKVHHLTEGKLREDCPAVFVGSVDDQANVVTDVFFLRKDSFQRRSSTAELHLTSVPVRGYNVFAVDIDGDGLVELPDVEQLPGADPENKESAYYMIRWYNYDHSAGLSLKLCTYHNYASGWFLRLPNRMIGKFNVQRIVGEGGTAGLRFSSVDRSGMGKDEIFTIFALSGEKKTATVSDHYFTLGTKGETSFAARLGPAADGLEITQEELVTAFQFIRVDWYTGET